MKFSTRTRYGLRAVLVLAGRFGEGSLSVSQIASQENISTPYLEQILNSLKKKNFVKSVRGPQGGYVLAQKPADITLHGLLNALQGTAAASPKLKSPKSAPQSLSETAIADHLFWQNFYQSIETGLSQVTLKQLLDEARRQKKSASSSLSTNFQI